MATVTAVGFVIKASRLRAARIKAAHGIQRMALGVPYGDEGRVNISTNPLDCLFNETAESLAVNFVDPDGDLDGCAEFGDVDDEFAGLTVVGEDYFAEADALPEPFPTW